MKWLTNTYDPTRLDAPEKVIRSPGESVPEAWRHKQDWLRDKIIGEPLATEHTANLVTLKRLHMVGVYEQEEDTNDDND